MNDHARILMRRRTVILVAVGLVATGSVATYLVMKRSGSAVPATTTSSPSAPVTPPAVGTASSNAPLPDVTVTLSREAVERAGIEVTPVVASSETGRIRVPGLVQPNAYRAVVVTPIAGGRITRVLVELGQQVRRGQTLAQAHSPELAEAQSRYLASRAELDAHERELRRTEKLTEIGAASRQELERVHAEHTAATTMVRSHQSRLTLLGMTEAQVSQLNSASEITATTSIPAPIDGVITTREANVGLNVDPAMPLFTVVDLSTVWVVGDVYERDLARVRVGSTAMVTTTAFPELMLEGKVSYIDPQIKEGTRTAQIRVEVPNPGRQLRLGMYAEMQVGDPRPGESAMVPRSAVQMVGDRSVVYLVSPSQQGQFVEREVRLGRTTDDMIEITAGVTPGDSIVSKGSFSLRAERERLGLRSATNPSATSTPPAPSAQSAQTARVTVSDKGFEPNRVTLRAGVPARITFVRTSETTCATEVTVPSMNIKRALPLNQPVDVEFTPQKSGDVEFVCGMNMLRGTIVIK